MPTPTLRQRAPYAATPMGDAAEPAAMGAVAPRTGAARTFDEVRSARQRRGGQAALAASVLRLSSRRR